jgi:hypothetical protein
MHRRPELPGWVRPASRVIVGLQSLGISFLSFHVLNVPGRRSGLMRKTVVSPFTVAGKRYVLSFGQLEWVRNARAAGWGELGRGRRRERIGLVEVTAPESVSIVREFPLQVPAGARFFLRLGLVQPPGGPDEFAAAAQRLTLFRLDSDQG